jgi:hypothetical protein
MNEVGEAGELGEVNPVKRVLFMMVITSLTTAGIRTLEFATCFSE